MEKKDTILKRHTQNLSRVGIKKVNDTLDSYYVLFINDVLKQIRNGNVDFVYRDYQINELKRFEPNLKVYFRDGIYFVWLPESSNLSSHN